MRIFNVGLNSFNLRVPFPPECRTFVVLPRTVLLINIAKERAEDNNGLTQWHYRFAIAPLISLSLSLFLARAKSVILRSRIRSAVKGITLKLVFPRHCLSPRFNATVRR